jgi:hypothetical protein
MGMQLRTFTAFALVFGVPRYVEFGAQAHNKEPGYDVASGKDAGRQVLSIEVKDEAEAQAILAALDKGATVAPPDVAEVTKAAAAPAPAPAPEKPKPAETAVVPAAQPESRRRRAAAPPPEPTPPPPEEDEEDDEEDEDVDNDDEEDDEEDQAVSAPPPIPDDLRAAAVPMKKFVVHFQSLGLKTEAQMHSALVALVPQCPALQKIGEAADILRRLQQTRAVLGVKD